MLKPIILGAMLFSGVVATPANATEVKLPPPRAFCEKD